MTTASRIAAEFYPVPRKGFGWLDIIEITPTGGRHQLHVGLRAANKREARKMAAEYGATPWNF